MKGLLANQGVLATAWFIVVALVASVAILAFLQPPPPPTGNPVTVSLLESPPPEDHPPAPAEPAAEAGHAAVPLPAAQGDHGPAAADHGTDQPPETIPQPHDETAASDHAAPMAEQHGGEQQAAAPEPHDTPTVKPEAAHGSDEHAAAPAENAGQGASAADKTADHGQASHGEAGAGATAPGATGHGTGDQAAADHGAADQAAAEGTEEAMVAIPQPPPSPEQLPPWKRYSQPFNTDDKRPRIAVVLTGLGLSDSATSAAINQLPPAVTLSFSPYARDLQRWIALARARGHEVMLDLPMEPATFPNEDPGPQALLTSLAPEDNLNRLDWVLARGSAYVGLAGSMGSRFTAEQSVLEPILKEMKDRGLMFLDRRTTESSQVPNLAEQIGLPFAINNRSVDERQASRVAIDARLAQIERIALTEGFAVAMAQPYPVTLERLAEWTTELSSRGFAIAPISALANRQKMP